MRQGTNFWTVWRYNGFGANFGDLNRGHHPRSDCKEVWTSDPGNDIISKIIWIGHGGNPKSIHQCMNRGHAKRQSNGRITPIRGMKWRTRSVPYPGRCMNCVKSTDCDEYYYIAVGILRQEAGTIPQKVTSPYFWKRGPLRNRARIVGKYVQVVNYTRFPMLLDLVGHHRLKKLQADFYSVFFNGNVQEELCVAQPDSF